MFASGSPTLSATDAQGKSPAGDVPKVVNGNDYDRRGYRSYGYDRGYDRGCRTVTIERDDGSVRRVTPAPTRASGFMFVRRLDLIRAD